MNKKIYAGLLSFGVAATFWACGSGDIIKADGGDDIMKVWPNLEDTEHADPGVTVGINSDVATKESCPECFIGEAPASSSSSSRQRVQRSSSSIFTPLTSSPSTVSSSSMEDINLSSSSSRIWMPPSSSSGINPPPIVSSSSAPVTPVGNGGTCAPVKAIVEQGESVIWKYSVPNDGTIKTTDMLSAQFKWSTPGGTPETLEGKGAKLMSDTVGYATSGQHTASLVLGTTKGTFNLTCSPVQVNGAKITGCKCSTEAKSVDFTKTPGVEWSVTGCTTGAELELSYEWDGAAGAATFTKTFTAATEKYSPKLYVKNNDNTMIEVECPSVKITDGPEFEITTTQGAGAIKLPKGTSNVVLSTDAYNNTVFCQVSRDDSPSGALNGTVNKTAIKGSDYIAVSMPAGTLVKGASLEFTLDVPATCGVQ